MRLSGTWDAWPNATNAVVRVRLGDAAGITTSRMAACATFTHAQAHVPFAQQSLSQSAGWPAGGAEGGACSTAVAALSSCAHGAVPGITSALVVTRSAS